METQRVRIGGPSIDALRSKHYGHEFVFAPMIRIPGVECGFRTLTNDDFDQSASSDWFTITGTLGGKRVSIKVTGYTGRPLRRRFTGHAEVTVLEADVHESGDVRLIPHSVHQPASK